MIPKHIKSIKKNPISTAIWGAPFAGAMCAIQGTAGYGIASIAGLSAAASVGSWTAMAGACFIGGAIMTAPVLLLTVATYNLNLQGSLLESLLHNILFIGAAATGAAVLGLAIKPFIICAAVFSAIGFTAALITTLVTGTRELIKYCSSNKAEEVVQRSTPVAQHQARNYSPMMFAESKLAANFQVEELDDEQDSLLLVNGNG